jgi:transposase
MARSGPRRVRSYSPEFKLRAVQLSQQPGVLVRDVAESLAIHPFMLSRWRKQARDGELRGTLPVLDLKAVGELQRLREVERDYKRLKMEHELLKRAIRFARELRGTSSRSLRRTGTPSR